MSDPAALEIAEKLAPWRDAKLPSGVFFDPDMNGRACVSLRSEFGWLQADLRPREAMTLAALLVEAAAPRLRRKRSTVRRITAADDWD
jgi:hypothetical protein